MIGPSECHPRSVLKRKQPPAPVPEVAAKRPQPQPESLVDIVTHVCNYETISEYIRLGGPTGSPASLESGYQTGAPDPDDEDSNLSWLLNFKVSSLFGAAEEQPPPKEEEVCLCSRTGGHRWSAGKPPFTYTELIEKALREQGELTVSGIYSWISTKYPYYNPNDDRWKNSVRHNLSINPHFRKGVKSRHGAGHLWTLSNEGVNPPPESWKRTRASYDTVVTAPRSESPAVLDEAAIAAANIMQLDPDPEEPEGEEGVIQQSDPVLHRVAGEILSGVKRRVEVQYLVHDPTTGAGPTIKEEARYPDHTIYLPSPSATTSWTSNLPYHFLENNSTGHLDPLYVPDIDFLNPVSKEELVSESGLDTDHCEVTNALFSELNADLHLPDNLFTEELGFACY